MTHAVSRNQDQLVEGVWVHDLCRTVATGLGKLGVQGHIIERVLNHAQEKLSATYNVHSYEAEKRAALQEWSKYLRMAIRSK